MTTAFDIHVTARLSPFHSVPVGAQSWFISHGLGTPAAGTFTEVIFEGEQPDEITAAVAVRQVADQLYSNRWAFVYRPDQYAVAIARHGMTRRERVVVTDIEVW